MPHLYTPPLPPPPLRNPQLPQRYLTVLHNPSTMEDEEALAAITASNARILTIAPHVYRATEREIARVAPKVRGLGILVVVVVLSTLAAVWSTHRSQWVAHTVVCCSTHFHDQPQLLLAQLKPKGGWFAPIFPVIFQEECVAGSWKLATPACKRLEGITALLSTDEAAPTRARAPRRAGICVQARAMEGEEDHGRGWVQHVGALSVHEEMAAGSHAHQRYITNETVLTVNSVNRNRFLPHPNAGQDGPRSAGLRSHF